MAICAYPPCGIEFRAAARNQKYHAVGCREKATQEREDRYRAEKAKVPKECWGCNRSFVPFDYRQRFCSRDCRNKDALIEQKNKRKERRQERERDGYVGWMFGGKKPDSPGNPIEGKEGCTRQIGCAHYSKCLNVAAFNGWRGFQCGGCGAFEKSEEKTEMIHMRSLLGMIPGFGMR